MGHKAFSESEPAKVDSEEARGIDQKLANWKQRKVAKSPRSFLGWPGILIGIGLGIAIASGTMRLFSPPSAKSPGPISSRELQVTGQSVTVAQVENTFIARTIDVTGTVAARGDLIPVLPQVADLQIKQVLVQEGDLVQAGQVMAVLDNSVIKAQLEQANAQLQSAQAVVGQRQAAVAQAEATLQESEQELHRYQALAKAGAISQQELSTRTTTVITNREAVRLAKANVTAAQADVRNNMAHVQQIRTQLAQTVVRSPVNGVVAEKIARIGDLTSATQKLFSIIQNGLLEVQAQVPATELPQVRVNAPALITSGTDSRVHLQGRVREIAPLVDVQSRQATVKIDVPSTNLLRPGLFVEAAITTNTTTGLTVPAQAVVSPTTGGHIVFVVDASSKVHARQVQVGEIVKGNSIEIKQGLKVGERVAVAGAGFLSDGERVQVVANLPASSSTNSP